MREGSRFFKLMNGMKIDTNDGYLYEYINDIFIEYELINRNIDGVDHQITLHTGNTYTPEQFNEKYVCVRGEEMNEAIIYDNRSSSCKAKFDGDVIHITQELKELDINNISLYVSELEQILELAKINT